jgi:hypothetical protein
LWPRFDGLDRAAAGARLGWQHKFGLGPFAPLLRLDVSGDLVAARESGRAGRAGSATLSARQRLSHWALAQVAHTWTRYDGRAHAFDRTGAETALSLTASPSAAWRATIGVRRWNGGVLSYATPPREDLIKEGKALTIVSTFDRADPLVAYYFIARTETLRLEVGRTLGPRAEFALGVEWRNTRRGALSYRNRIVSAGVLFNL